MGSLGIFEWLSCILAVGLTCTTPDSTPAVPAVPAFSPSSALYQSMQSQALNPEDAQECLKQDAAFAYCFVLTKKGWKVWDSQMQEPYQVYMFDNGPDGDQEGYFRVRAKGKIGYASARTGLLTIPAKYDGAFPFQNGIADVCVGCQEERDVDGHGHWVGGAWHKINRQGNTIDDAS